ncbi:MAG TPA: DUF58 domain-containing protein [Fastidiosipila sp.]|nr:DUF58 domain-containing protein [Fastidiosipila sp.]
MTRRLTFIILLLLLFWVGASYLQFSVFRLLMIALILLVAASFVHLMIAKKRVRILSPTSPNEVTRGQMLNVVFPIEVRLWLVPIQIMIKAWYGLNESVERPMKRQLQVTAGPKETKTLIMQVEGRHCGRVEMDDIQIRLRDTFNLFYARLPGAKARFSHEALVLPRFEVEHLIEEWAKELLDEGEKARQRVEERTEEIDTIRHYRPGDTMKSIHWKLSSRQNKFIVKQYEMPKEIRFCLMTDPALPFDQHNDLLARDRLLDQRDYMLETMAGAVFYLLTHGMHATLITFFPDKMLQKSMQVEHLRHFRRQLALVPTESTISLEDQLLQEGRSDYYDYYLLQTTRLSEGTLTRIQELMREARGILLLYHYAGTIERETNDKLRSLINAGVHVKTLEFPISVEREVAFDEVD